MSTSVIVPPGASQSSPKRSSAPINPVGRGSKIFTRRDQERFIKKWLKLKSVPAAAKAIGFREGTIYKQVRKSPRFAKMYDRAMHELVRGLGTKMIAFGHGVETPVHNAQITAMFGVLKAYEPERWRENLKVGLNAEGSLGELFAGLLSALPRPELIPDKSVLEHKP